MSETDIQRLEREVRGKKLKDQVEVLWTAVRRYRDENIFTQNKYADLREAVCDVLLFGGEKDMAYLRKVYEKSSPVKE